MATHRDVPPRTSREWLCHAEPSPAAIGRPSNASEHLTDGVSGVSRVVELPDGRLAMVDLVGPALVIFDPTTGTRIRSGRRGDGPGEFRHPQPVLLLYPDTIAIAERLSRRLHLFTLDGAFVRDASMPAGPFYVTATVFSDTTGTLIIINQGDLGREAAGEQVDSIAIMRGRPDGQEADLIWSLGVQSWRRVPKEVGETLLRPVFGDTDASGVAADGRVFRVSAARQMLQVWQDGVVRDLGQAWGLSRMPITTADRDSVTLAMNAIPFYRGVKPPFAAQRAVIGRVHVAFDGEVWVELTAPRDGKLVYRVIQSDGHHRYDVALPAGTAVIGFGRAHVFLRRTTDDEEGELLRAPRP